MTSMSLDGLPGVAQVAIQGARYAAKVITARLDGKPAPPSYSTRARWPPSRASVVVSVGALKFGGFIGWLAWLGVYAPGLRHRLQVA